MSVPPIDPIQPPPGPDANSGYYPPAGAPRTQLNVLALIGFITAITGLGCGIISLILSIIGLSQINKEPNRYNGKGLAIAGIIISAGSIVYALSVYGSFLNTGF